MNSKRDHELWARATHGDTDAFALFYDRYSTRIYNYCFRHVGDWSLAEDLVSVVFLEAWRRRDVLLEEGKVLPWLLGIATNVMLNTRRSLRRYEAALSRIPIERGEVDSADDANRRLDEGRDIRYALSLLARLPREEQVVFRLCVWENLKYEDAAFALGIPIGTVRSRLSRARKNLRELYAASGH